MTERVDGLRAAFDRSFADAPAISAGAHLELLRVRAASAPYAIVLAEVSGIHFDLKVTPMPSRAPEFLGIASIRSAMIPVFDLRILLGAAAETAPRWLVISREAPALALAFDGFDGLARVPSSAIADPAGTALRGTVVVDHARHQIIDVTSIAKDIRTRWDRKG